MTARLVRASRITFSDLRRELDLPTQLPLAAQRKADGVRALATGFAVASPTAPGGEP